MLRIFLTICLCVFQTTSILHAGLYCSHERYADLPSSWKGFLADLRALRMAGLPPSPQTPSSALRQEFTATVEQLQTQARQRALAPEESADLGALLIRLGKVDAGMTVLREAALKHPEHFALQANLGTAWQLSGDLHQAAEHLRQAVRLAPEERKSIEQLHLRLVNSRLRQGSTPSGLDDLFGISYSDAQHKHRLGRLTAGDRENLPKNAVALIQQLALWFPTDGRLLWQLGELAAVYGDLGTATIILEACVGEFGLADQQLRHSRQALLAAFQARGQMPVGQASQQDAHSAHAGAGQLVFKSRRPLIQRTLDPRNLPPVRQGQNHLIVWQLLAETAMDPRRFKPTYHAYLQKLEGEQITLTGFMQPLTDDLECTSFLLVENPIGCWYCEMPQITGIVFASMQNDKTIQFTRNVIKVTGNLKLNITDPEDFLFTLTNVKVGQPD